MIQPVVELVTIEMYIQTSNNSEHKHNNRCSSLGPLKMKSEVLRYIVYKLLSLFIVAVATDIPNNTDTIHIVAKQFNPIYTGL